MTSAHRNGRLVGAGVLVLLVVLALLGAWFRHTFHRVEKTLYLPPTGEAAYNPLYALAKTLEADGVKVNARQRLLLDDNALAPTDTLLLFNDPRTLSPPDAERLLDWVEGGGHLLVRTPLFSPGEDVAGPDAPRVPLLDRLSVWLVEESPGCVDFQVEGEDHHVEFCTGRRFAFEGEVPELAWGDLQAGYVYARLARGRGVIWQTREPFPSTVVVTRERVVEQAPDGATSVLLDGAGSPGAALVNALLLALVAGDLDALARGFEVTAGDAPAGGWALLLVPRDARLRQVLERIELGGDRHVERVELLERGGDRSRIVFSALTDSPAALAPDEAAQLD